jgi:hypothetical protein
LKILSREEILNCIKKHEYEYKNENHDFTSKLETPKAKKYLKAIRITMIFFKKMFLLLFFCYLSIVLHAQVTYQWTPIIRSDGQLLRYEMHDIDFLNVVDNGLVFSIDASRFTQPNMTGFSNLIRGFEFTPDFLQVFFMEEEGDLYRYNIANDSLEYLGDLTPEITPLVLVHFYTVILDIFFINDSLLYCAGFTYGIYNVNTGVFEKLRQPANHPIGFSTREQEIACTASARYKDKYIYKSGPGSESIMVMDLANPSNNSKLFDFGSIGTIISNLPIVTYQHDCDSLDVFVFGNLLGNNFPRAFYRIDMDTGVPTYSHDFLAIPGVGGKNFPTIKRYNSPTWESCQRHIDLDVDNSTVEGIDFRYDSLCIFAAAPLSDLDIKIRNEYPIDSLVIEVLAPLSPNVDINIPSGNYTITSSNTAWRIINNGTTSVADYMNAVKNASLNNLDQVNEVTLQYTVWYDSIGGNPAIATLVFPASLPNAGTDITQTYCDGDTALTTLRLPSNEADLGGTFYDANFNIITNLETSVPPYDAVIYYEATNGICYDTAQINLSISPIPTLVGLEDVVTCFNNEYKTEINVDNNSFLIWSDGNPDPMRILTDAGTYAYQITNQYGCIASDTFTIIKLPPATSMTTDEQICNGETFTYMEKVYDTPGNNIDTIKNVYGCDSVFFKLNLGVYPFIPIVLAGDLSFCDGNSTSISIESPHNQLMLNDVNVISPITLTESGDFLIAGTDQNGCITEKEISITILPNPEVLTLDIIDTVFVKGLALPVSYDGDIETYRWSPSTALDCADCPFPTMLTTSEGIYTIAIEDKNGCKNESQLSITFLDTKLYLPNVISNHSNDPENEVFYIKGNNSQLYSLSVYDRWGNLIFHRKDAEVNNKDDAWSPRGKVASGVYVYLINYKENGESKTLYGSITVLD